MLPSAARLRTPADFAAAVRSGVRGSSPTMVVHLRLTARPGPARAGFVVSKKVGNSVVRHRVTRRLRPLLRERLALLRPGSDLVIRALPPAAAATSAVLAGDLDSCLSAALRRAERRQVSGPGGQSHRPAGAGAADPVRGSRVSVTTA